MTRFAPQHGPVLDPEHVEVEVDRVPVVEVDAPTGRDQAHERRDRVPEAPEEVHLVLDEARQHALQKRPELQPKRATQG